MNYTFPLLYCTNTFDKEIHDIIIHSEPNQEEVKT